jgi:hypothetical protein
LNHIPKIYLSFLLIFVGVFLIYPTVSAAGLVPCGRLQDDPSTPEDETRMCTTCDIFALASRIINFVLFTLVPAAAVLLYLVAGLIILLAGANPAWFATGKSIFKTTTWGVIIVFSAWMITNTVLKSLAGDSDVSNNWFRIECTAVAQGNPSPVTRYACNSQNQCVVNPNGEYVNDPTCGGKCAGVSSPSPSPSSTPPPNNCFDVDENGIINEIDCGAPENDNCNLCGGGPPTPTITRTPTPTPSPSSLACIYNGVNYATFNLCSGQRRPGGCGGSRCSQYVDSINRYANGAATVQLLETMMVIESDCNIKAGTASSYGLMQLQPATANRFKNRCGVTENITPAWLTSPANADKSICIAAAFINSIAAGTCGSQPRNIYAGYNAGPGNCAPSNDCANDKSCDGGVMRKWECPYDDPQHTSCNSGMYQTKQGATYVNYCLNNLGF